MEHVTRQTEQVYADAITAFRSSQIAHGKTVLCGYYGFGNMGDDALLRAAIARTKREAPTQTISALTKRGRRDGTRFGVRGVRRTSPFAVGRELRGAEHLVFGGGTLLQERTSLRSLLYYTALLHYAQSHGVRTELWANGLGEITSTIGQKRTRAALLGCSHVGLRDAHSLAFARKLLGERTDLSVCAEEDLALATPSANAERIAFLQKHYGLEGAFAVIAPKGHAPSGTVKFLREWLCVLRAEKVRLLFIPLYPREDTALCQRLAAHPNDRIATALSPSDLVGLMAQARVVCGMRLHALVFSSAAGTPFVGFGTDPKIEAFCREHGGILFTDLY